MLKDTIKTLVASFIVLSLISVAYAWTEPASNPPAGNVSAPITNSSTAQVKIGDFGIKGLLRGYDTGALLTGTTFTNPVSGACPSGYYWVDENGNGAINNGECKIISLYAGSTGNVGIGTANPGATYKLDVAGAINTTGGLYVSGTRKDTVWDGKQAAITGGASTITASNLTASRALVSDASGKVVVSGTTGTELGYVSGVTSAIQTQLNTKAPTASPTFTGNVTVPAPTASNHAATKGYVDALASAPVWAYRNCLVAPWAPFGVPTTCIVICPTGTTIQAWKKAYNVGATDGLIRVAIGVLSNSYENSSLGTCTLGASSCSVSGGSAWSSLGVICAK